MERNEIMIAFLAGVGTGAALMYFLDPDRGARRRALVRDKAVALGNDARRTLNTASQDLSNRAYGVYAQTSRSITGNPIDASDATEH